ncbi:ectonucleoside triphosphate diphosphohydrolase 5-like isoform X2 [Branchiostoma floridae]|uniref:nucleoside diphosphate phosphatase n=2 Tax=Branchiostoma floridae TaxID=7739 RepID=A0A9J7LXY5_BRAFL|nr:ectonucleoside triphosphate diphosphohydrolase 5-like isoform X2 [Branchiostoma floridae]
MTLRRDGSAGMSLVQLTRSGVVMGASGLGLFLVFLVVHSGRLTLQHQAGSDINVSSDRENGLIQEVWQRERARPGRSQILYGVMIDAGSTGSRLHVFKFRRNSEDDITLVSEKFESIKPGLSSYADDPDEGAASIRGLVQIAQEVVPVAMQRTTPLALKATAGLRMLPEAKAQTLLDKVQEVFEASPFLVRKDSVVVMNGLDEGLFAWFTVNFLIGALGSKEKHSTKGALDLGGGSTQITFSPRDKETLRSSPESFVRPVTIFHKTYMLYVHSYLGFGLMAARLRMMGMETEDINRRSVKGSLRSACLPADFRGAFEHSGMEYPVSGLPEGEAGFGACWAAALAMVSRRIHQPDEVRQEPFYAFSYYFDRAKESGMIGEEGGSLKVSKFKQRAEEVCRKPLPEYPFMCMDLCYISALLQEGFGFNPNNVLMLRKKIDGVETSWALGATFRMLS